MRLFLQIALVSAVTFLRVASGAAEDLGESEYLLGDWNSSRTKLEEQGLKLEVVSTTELVHNAAGGLTRGTKALENVDVSAELDTEKLQWWKILSLLPHRCRRKTKLHRRRFSNLE